jgi:hypothetical protein
MRLEVSAAVGGFHGVGRLESCWAWAQVCAVTAVTARRGVGPVRNWAFSLASAL